jgi:hypothetical protein
MLRARLAVVLLAGGLGLVCGCSSLCNHPWFHRNRTPCPEVIDLGVTPLGEGPMLEGSAPGFVPPNGSTLMPQPMGPPPNGSTLMPQPTVPQLSTPPRLSPQPQSQPMPYTP